jgi:hypothetical protein
MIYSTGYSALSSERITGMSNLDMGFSQMQTLAEKFIMQYGSIPEF